MINRYDASLDVSNMKDYIKSWPDQVARSWEAGFTSGSNDPVDPPSLLIWAGMGGSAAGGDYCAAIGAASASFPILVHRGGELPAYVNKDTRLMLVSFSGNTSETLDTAEQAKARGCKIDILTSGGKLKEWAEAEGITPWLIPAGRPPRAALGDSSCYVLGAFAGRGWIDVDEDDPREAVSTLVANGMALGRTPDGNHELDPLIEALSGRFPMIYGTGKFVAVARRWANQINENCKRPAHWGELPEMNHNEVVAYVEESDWAPHASVIILEDPSSPAEVLKRVEVTKRLGEEFGWRTDIIRPTATGALSQMVEMTLHGDWLSYWIALSEGVDPSPVPVIEKLKGSL